MACQQGGNILKEERGEEGHTDEAADEITLDPESTCSPQVLSCSGHSLGLAGLIESQAVV